MIESIILTLGLKILISIPNEISPKMIVKMTAIVSNTLPYGTIVHSFVERYVAIIIAIVRRI